MEGVCWASVILNLSWCPHPCTTRRVRTPAAPQFVSGRAERPVLDSCCLPPGADFSVLAQVAAGKAHEHVFQTRLTRGQVKELGTAIIDGFKQSRNRSMRFAHIQADQPILAAHGFYSGQGTPDFRGCATGIAAD